MKKWVKRISALLLAGILVMGMAGCKSNEESSKEQKTSEKKNGSNRMYDGMSAKETVEAVLEYMGKNCNCVTILSYKSGEVVQSEEQMGYVDHKYYYISKIFPESGGILYTFMKDENYTHPSECWLDDWEKYSRDEIQYLEDDDNDGTVTAYSESRGDCVTYSTYFGALRKMAEESTDDKISREDDGDSIKITISMPDADVQYVIQNGVVVSASQSDRENRVEFRYMDKSEKDYEKMTDLFENGEGTLTSEVDEILAL